VDFHKITTDAYAIAKVNLDAFPWDGPLVSDVSASQLEAPDTEFDMPADEEEDSSAPTPPSDDDLNADYL
jgi:hypothetical protein